jgi:hypothetical protein
VFSFSYEITTNDIRCNKKSLLTNVVFSFHYEITTNLVAEMSYSRFCTRSRQTILLKKKQSLTSSFRFYTRSRHATHIIQEVSLSYEITTNHVRCNKNSKMTNVVFSFHYEITTNLVAEMSYSRSCTRLRQSILLEKQNNLSCRLFISIRDHDIQHISYSTTTFYRKAQQPTLEISTTANSC